MFSFSWTIIRPNTRDRTGTFSECIQYGISYCNTIWDPIFYALGECTSTVFYVWPDDGSIESKHVAEFLILIPIYFFLLWRCDPTRVMAPSFLRFLDHTQRRTTVGRTPLDEWSARRRDLYLTAYNTHNRQTSMPPVGFEPTISAGERPQT